MTVSECFTSIKCFYIHVDDFISHIIKMHRFIVCTNASCHHLINVFI